jgi:hypothetical protein
MIPNCNANIGCLSLNIQWYRGCRLDRRYDPVLYRLLPLCLLFWSAQAALCQNASICAQVKIQISQQLALERQAFQATMTIDNGVAGVPLTGINVNMNFTDPSGNAVRATSDPNDLTALFFFRLQNGSSIPATIPGASSSTITWLIVPSLGAAGPNSSGQFYSVGATLSYLSGGQTNVVQVSPATISVLPLPDLMLDYFLPSDVYGDDPFTEVVEPPIPFSLGVRVKNTGYGVAESLRIQSAQPQIIDNKQGLLVSFQILGSEVNGQPATPSLLANFGDIQPNRSGVARWIITSTLSGRFISFTASFTHSDDLGGKLTSLISNVTTHVLVHDVLVDLPGRDNIRDFLALDGSVLRVYESQNADTIVADQSATGSITGGGPTYTVTTTPSSGFIYLKLPDPLAGTQTLRSAVRADGKTLNPANAWLSQTQDRNTHLWSYFVNVFDVNNTAGAAYTLQYAPSAGTTNHPPHLNPINNWTVAPGNYLSFPITATDPDANSLTYSFASTPPSGATLDPTTGQFSWRPTQTQASTTNLFTVQVTDNGTPNLSDTGSFTVIVTSATTPPAITAQPLNQTNNAGTVASFTVSATGSSPLSYQWYKNTTNLLSDAGNVFGSTNATLSISNVLGIDAGDYSATISNAAGIVISSNATLVVIDPIITNPPISLVQTAGMTAQFSVGAFGTQPLSYQWQSNGADLADGGRISGSTSNVLTIVNLVVSDTANYQVLVTNVYGSTNVVATLTVLKAIPSLTWTNPVTIPYGTALSTAQLNASANVPGTFVFSPPAGTVLNAGSNSLSVVFTPRDAANFSSATDAVSIVVSPAPLTVTANDALRAFGQPNPVFTGTIQGLVNGDNITASYSSAATPNSAPGTYPIVPSLLDPNNRLGNYQSTLVNGTLTVGLIPQISSQPTNESVPLGSNVVFTVAASGTAPLTYQWLKANNLISGATATALSLNAVSDSDAAAYSVAVSNAFGSVTGLVATLIVIDPPAITAQPGSRTNVAGTTASFAVQASGTAPLSYQWQFNGTNLTANSQFSGVTASSLTISNVQAANAGNYTVVVTNSAGTTTSLAAALTVIGPPGILTQPMSQTVIAGTNLSFSVTAFGTPPLNYQWRFQGTNLINGGQFSGVTTPTLTINNVLSANAGGYSVLITNMAGSVTSSVATLTVLVPPTFTSQPQSRTNNVGTTSIFSAAATGTAPLAYQWQLNGLNLTNGGRISGATSNNLSCCRLISNRTFGEIGIVLILVS